MCNPGGCPRGQRQDPGLRTQKDGSEGWMLSDLSCALTQVLRWMPRTPPPQTMNIEKNKRNCETESEEGFLYCVMSQKQKCKLT